MTTTATEQMAAVSHTDRKPRLEYEHRFSFRFGNPHYIYSLVGAEGAVHFHVTDYGEEFRKRHGDRYSGGLETHYRSPPDYMRGDAPSQQRCWLLGCPCWHDGTSLYASETLIPRWEMDKSHEAMQAMLVREYAERFGNSEVKT